ncbi:FAD/NAD(P)-binding domain-containing protein [Curvularia clavata]|uniref:FAD/NAD(P)-binding domain-containing protein n=1 Tax=Curvularia clavata TaxID=95742 RepID=A0A9Q9DQ85_CURCL|nr:FAD/NAD(P)-binding domain-containing protein [Curvularia clavata]
MGAFKVIIVGGGLSGALLGNGLNNNGVDFMIYERDNVDSKREGYQIRIGPGAQAGFRACLTNAHIEKITAKLGQSSGSQATAPLIYNTKFDEILNLTLVPTYTKSAAINRVVLRDLLLEPIKKSERIKYGKGFNRYEIVTQKDGRERVKVCFSDGSHDICDVLVGADGANSKINKQLGLNNIHLIDSHWSFLSKGSLPFDRMMELPSRLRVGPILVHYNDISLFYALYLPESEVSSESDSTVDMKKPLEYDEKAASFYWALNIPVDGLPYKKASEIQNPRQVCLETIKEWAPEFQHMLSVGADEPEKIDMLVTQLHASTQPEANWRTLAQRTGNEKGHPRVWVIGDAIHAMQPTRGQGGNQALADCADMLPQLLHLNSLSSMGRGNPTLEEIKMACDKYESAMMVRAFPWVRKSGGISFPRLNLDGFLGIIVHFAAKIVMPLLRLYCRIFSHKGDE